MKTALLTISLATLLGCVTETPTKQMPKGTRICTFFDTSDVLTAVVGQSAVQGVSKRMEKYLAKNLNDRGIKTGPSESFSTGDAKVTVKLSAIESVSATSPGFWAPIVRQQPKIKYTGAVLSEDGTTILSFDDEQDDESLDTLTRKIADKVAQRVAKCYK